MADFLSPSDYFEGRIFARGLDLPIGASATKGSTDPADLEAQIAWHYPNTDTDPIYAIIRTWKQGLPFIGTKYNLLQLLGDNTIGGTYVINLAAQNLLTLTELFIQVTDTGGGSIVANAGTVPHSRKIIDSNGKSDFVTAFGNQGLKVVHGRIDTTLPTILNGIDFSVVRNGVGNVTITFSTAFSSVPAVIATGEANAATTDIIAFIDTQTAISTSVVRISLKTSTGASQDGVFDFTAIGQI